MAFRHAWPGPGLTQWPFAYLGNMALCTCVRSNVDVTIDIDIKLLTCTCTVVSIVPHPHDIDTCRLRLGGLRLCAMQVRIDIKEQCLRCIHSATGWGPRLCRVVRQRRYGTKRDRNLIRRQFCNANLLRHISGLGLTCESAAGTLADLPINNVRWI